MALQQRSLPWGLLFSTSLNWKSRENESRHPHMEWAIGLTLTCPQTAKWKNSFIYVIRIIRKHAVDQSVLGIDVSQFWMKYDFVTWFFVTFIFFPLLFRLRGMIWINWAIPCVLLFPWLYNDKKYKKKKLLIVL